jgi:hypothetical protein
VAGLAPQLEVTRREYSYQMDGDVLRLIFTCPPDAGVPSPDGLFSADRRSLVVQFALPEAVLEYDRASPVTSMQTGGCWTNRRN